MKNQILENQGLENLRDRIKFRRQNLHLTLQQIADESGTTKSTLSRFLNGRGGVDTDTRLKLGNWLGIPASEIFGQQSVETTGGDTLADIQKLISADETIPEDKRADLCAWFETTYETFKKR